jgi:hypothetical protein
MTKSTYIEPYSSDIYLSEEDQLAEARRKKQEILIHIQNKFDTLRERVVNFATSETGIFKGLLVTGPAGIGKSVTIEQALKEANQITKKQTYQLIKGKVSPVGFYAALYKNCQKNRIVWFDDVSGILDDETSLEILKAATSRQYEPRRITWGKAQSTYFRDNNIPNSFDYQGHLIISTNRNVSPTAQTKKFKEHFSAITSRMPPTDLTLSKKETYIWTEYLIRERGMLGENCISHKGGFPDQIVKDTLAYLYQHQSELHELTPRIADAIAGARYEWGPEKGYESNKWKVVADQTTGRFRKEVKNGEE